MNFNREDLVQTKEYMNAIADGYKIFTEFNDRFMVFSVRKKINGNTFDYPFDPSIRIYDLAFFKIQLEKAKKEIEFMDAKLQDKRIVPSQFDWYKNKLTIFGKDIEGVISFTYDEQKELKNHLGDNAPIPIEPD